MKKNIKRLILLTSLMASINLIAEDKGLALSNKNSIISSDSNTTTNTNDVNREHLIISKFDIIGNKNININNYIKNINIKKGDVFNPDKIKSLMDEIMLTGYFSNIKPIVNADTLNKTIDITLELTENPVIKSVKINGLTIFKPEELGEKIGLKAGSVYNFYMLDPQKSPLIGELINVGLLAPIILDANMDEEGNLTIDLSEGRISKIEYIKKTPIIKENQKLEDKNFKLKTKEFILKRNQTIKVGDFLTIKGIQNTSQNLFRTGLFDTIEPKFEIDPLDPQKRVVIFEVEERRLASINLQLSYSRENGLVGESSLSDNNFLGGQQEVSIAASFGTTGSYSLNASYWNPWIKNTKRLQFGGKVYLNKNITNDKDLLKEVKLGDEVLGKDFSKLINIYETKTIGISTTIGKGIARDLYVSLKPEISYTSANTQSGINLQNIIQGAGSLSITYDKRDDAYLPKSGYAITTTVELNSVIRDSSYTPAAIKQGVSFLLKKQKEFSDVKANFDTDDYNKKLNKYEGTLPFDPIKEKVLLSEIGKKEIEKKVKEIKADDIKSNIENVPNGKKVRFNPRLFAKFETEILAFKPIIKDINSIALKAYLGWASKSTSESSLFIVDNYGKSMRGYNEATSTKTNFLISTSLENRFYVNKSLQLLAFIDSGIYANETGNETPEGYKEYTTPINTLKNFKNNIKVSTGAGIRIYTRLGTIRVDYGIPLTNTDQKGGKISFGFGHSF